MTQIRILGIDPSLSNFGFAKMIMDVESGGIALVELELCATEPEKSKTVRKNSIDLDRARKLYQSTGANQAWADVVAVEVPVGSQSARAMASYGICVGILASIHKPLIQLTPSQVKIAAVNDKNASKEEMIAWATAAYPNGNWLKHAGKIVAKNEHLADAVAAVHAATRVDDFKLITTILR
jgi:Holliday junction resolvasome RuvABC endonuclease subunit